MRVTEVSLLKKLIAMFALLAAGFIGGGLLGFALGYVIAGEGRNNIHGGAILVGLLTIGGAIAGLIVGTLTAYRVGQRVTWPVESEHCGRRPRLLDMTVIDRYANRKCSRDGLWKSRWRKKQLKSWCSARASSAYRHPIRRGSPGCRSFLSTGASPV